VPSLHIAKSIPASFRASATAATFFPRLTAMRASTAKLKALSTGRNNPAELFNELFFREFTKPSLRGGSGAGIRAPKIGE
jgi:hypothetical protein